MEYLRTAERERANVTPASKATPSAKRVNNQKEEGEGEDEDIITLGIPTLELLDLVGCRILGLGVSKDPLKFFLDHNLRLRVRMGTQEPRVRRKPAGGVEGSNPD